ncbi:type VI secretion system baseplate subunit TssG [Thermomonas sp.]|uniref:type VI secretion system baseplate subunit TssG n=1 Tax=Thermomonas sp. TaxID=1971895 RepID=UPI001B62439C|nr:type VI secretion system baseplate subunit TssG [Thermomonas sp.]MBP6438946.1 type VI secretion system baseplate subunit TssG [Thermomonas sp.]MBP7788094.1 type VI secretion system baseplate subunit TssG [Thermomonas sp.]MBP8615366.1 type VI secretion system baseplate subunit TssG [Thermomonas sp.]
MSLGTPIDGATASPLVAPGDPMQPAIDRLLNDPGRFGFFQAVRLLYSVGGFDGRGTGARPGPLRFTTPASLSFPPSELHSIAQADASTRVCVNFFGLTGPSGVLPRTYTELLIARKQVQRDQSAQEFFDLFNHRLVSLFWLAWAKHRPEIGRQFGFNNSVYRYLEHIVGLGTPALQARLHPTRRGATPVKPLPSAALSYFSGLIAQRPHGERAIAQVVSAVVAAPVQATGCLGTWQDIAADARTRLGRGNHRLGAGCVLGTRYWDRQTTLRLTIGPIDRARFNALLPRGARLADIIELTRFLTGLALDLRIRLSLRADQVPPLRLGARDQDRPQLGWNTWLRGRSDPRPANDCEFHFSALGGQSWH